MRDGSTSRPTPRASISQSTTRGDPPGDHRAIADHGPEPSASGAQGRDHQHGGQGQASCCQELGRGTADRRGGRRPLGDDRSPGCGGDPRHSTRGTRFSTRAQPMGDEDGFSLSDVIVRTPTAEVPAAAARRAMPKRGGQEALAQPCPNGRRAEGGPPPVRASTTGNAHPGEWGHGTRFPGVTRGAA